MVSRCHQFLFYPRLLYIGETDCIFHVPILILFTIFTMFTMQALLYRKYSVFSDVWSFGVVLFEIFSLGKKPFFGMSPPRVISFVSEDRKRLPPPPGVSRDLYKLMLQCWHPDHRKRPEFDHLVQRLSRTAALLAPVPQSSALPQQAYSIGGPLHATEAMYEDLQTMYCTQP
eukprot:scpid90996/ scgid0977/ Ephrin type-A receptor 3; EPH-like kinase 4; Tyrosine-protein kinase TYRO4; Tyrosine-protein kinase receptor ETK1